MIKRRSSSGECFDLVPPMPVAAVFVLDSRTALLVWGFAHSDLAVSFDRGIAVSLEDDRAPITSTALVAEGVFHGFEGSAEVASAATRLESFRIGETPEGFIEIGGASRASPMTGQELTLFVVGSRTLALQFNW